MHILKYGELFISCKYKLIEIMKMFWAILPLFCQVLTYGVIARTSHLLAISNARV